MENSNEIKLTALQKAKKKYYEKIKNDPEYIAKRNSPETRAIIRECSKRYYNKIKNDPEFKQKVSTQKKEYYNKKKAETYLLEINL
jgi:phage-related tail protein